MRAITPEEIDQIVGGLKMVPHAQRKLGKESGTHPMFGGVTMSASDPWTYTNIYGGWEWGAPNYTSVFVRSPDILDTEVSVQANYNVTSDQISFQLNDPNIAGGSANVIWQPDGNHLTFHDTIQAGGVTWNFTASNQLPIPNAPPGTPNGGAGVYLSGTVHF